MVFQFAVAGVPIAVVVDLVFADLAAVDPASPDPAFVALVFDALARADGVAHRFPLHRYRLPTTRTAIAGPIYCSQGEETLRLIVGFVPLACHKVHILGHLVWYRFDVLSDHVVSDWV